MYKIIGADQQEYGPITLEELRRWTNEGRVNGSTMISVGGGPFQPLAGIAELAGLLPLSPPPMPAHPEVPEDIQKRVSNPATFLLVAAGLSVLGEFREHCGKCVSNWHGFVRCDEESGVLSVPSRHRRSRCEFGRHCLAGRHLDRGVENEATPRLWMGHDGGDYCAPVRQPMLLSARFGGGDLVNRRLEQTGS